MAIYSEFSQLKMVIFHTYVSHYQRLKLIPSTPNLSQAVKPLIQPTKKGLRKSQILKLGAGNIHGLVNCKSLANSQNSFAEPSCFGNKKITCGEFQLNFGCCISMSLHHNLESKCKLNVTNKIGLLSPMLAYFGLFGVALQTPPRLRRTCPATARKRLAPSKATDCTLLRALKGLAGPSANIDTGKIE